jgi:UDP-glucuronate 4-epimerase
MKHVLLTGGAGFIGSHLSDLLLPAGWRITAIDNFDPFYDRSIKTANIQGSLSHPAYELIECDIRNTRSLESLPDKSIDVIVHLAAKAGVQPSLKDPVAYQEVNVAGTQNLLEFARRHGVKQFVFASSSSVYGISPRVPWTEADTTLMPISPYASTKLSAEYLGHVYSHLYGIRFLSLRFFTVYGPRQRPDLAIHKFARSVLSGSPIQMFGDGSSRRDYTHVSDIVRGICAAMNYSATPFEIINLGNNRTVELRELIATLEEVIGRKARVERLPNQPGDVPQTWADLTKATELLGYRPEMPLRDGLRGFVEWLVQSPARVPVPDVRILVPDGALPLPQYELVAKAVPLTTR